MLQYLRWWFCTILANLIFGNLILYNFAIHSSHQNRVDPALLASYSSVSAILLLVLSKILKTYKSKKSALIFSLLYSFLVEWLGFFIAGCFVVKRFSISGLVIGFILPISGFFILAIPMCILNYFLFRFAQRIEESRSTFV